MANLNKIYTVSALSAALLMGSCLRDNNAVDPESTGNRMSFDVAEEFGGTRGKAIWNASDMNTMGIFGYSTGKNAFNVDDPTQTPNLFHNRYAERQSGTWVYTPPVYWPIDLTINNSFFAYAPHSSMFHSTSNVSVSTSSDSGYPTLTYTLPPDVKNTKDILYSVPVLDRNRMSVNSNNKKGTVLYSMKHATAWLAFVVCAAQYDNPNETYSVSWLAYMATRQAVTSTLNLGTGAWSTPTYGSVRYEFDLNANAQNIKPNTGARVVADNSYLMMLPFDILGTDNASVDITFTYNKTGLPGGEDPDEYYFTVPMPTVFFNDEAGKVVVFLINISKEGASVVFSESNWIEDWKTGGSGTLEIF